MYVFLVLIITLGGGKPPDAFVLGSGFDSEAACRQARDFTSGRSKKLIGTRKTDGTEVIGTSAICVTGTETDTRESIKARVLRERR